MSFLKCNLMIQLGKKGTFWVAIRSLVGLYFDDLLCSLLPTSSSNALFSNTLAFKETQKMTVLTTIIISYCNL